MHCDGTFFGEVDQNMERLGAPLPKDTQGVADKMIDLIGKLAAVAALNPTTPATTVIGSTGVVAAAVGLAGVTAAWYAGLLIGSLIRAGVIRASCGINGAMQALRSHGIYDVHAIENEIISDPRLRALFA